MTTSRALLVALAAAISPLDTLADEASDAMASSSWRDAAAAPAQLDDDAPDGDVGAPASSPHDDETRADDEDARAALRDRLDALEERLARVERDNERLRRAASARPAGAPHLTLGDGFTLRPRGFVDVGAFYAFGDGAAYIRDVDRSGIRRVGAFPMLLPFPERAPPDDSDAAWVYLGDPWANPVNTQGDPAHLGADRSIIHRFDPISKRGGFSFLVNTVGVGFIGALGSSLAFETLFLVEPRSGALGAPGDVFSLPLAFLDWRPVESVDLHVYVGKVTSAFGREYREQFAPDRFGITPSLLARYTTGNPVGAKTRLRLFDGLLTAAGALTNGGMSTERFGLFAEDIDSNTVPTGTVRVSSEGTLPIVPLHIEAGASVLIGFVDGDERLVRLAHQVGVDVHAELDDFALDLEYVRGEVPKDEDGEGHALSFDGFVATATLRATNVVGVLARVDARRALLFTAPNLYVSDVARLTVGARFDLSYHLVLKLEAVHVMELTTPEIPDDVLTSSLVLRF